MFREDSKEMSYNKFKYYKYAGKKEDELSSGFPNQSKVDLYDRKVNQYKNWILQNGGSLDD